MIKRKEKQESQWIREIAYIMKVRQGPFTKAMIFEELLHIHPDKARQELFTEIMTALSDDKYYNKPRRFKTVKLGWYDLAERN